MINNFEILETMKMFDEQHLDIRTITMGISLMDCAASTVEESCQKIYDKICRYAGNLVEVGDQISKKYGVPIIHKRISVTPISLVAGASNAQNYVPYIKTLDKCAHELGVNFIAGWIAPLFAPLGLGDWRIVVALISGFLAKESVVSSLEVLGATAFLTQLTAIPLLVFCLLYTPCIASITAVKREFGWLWALGMVLFQCILAWIVAYLSFLLASALGF